MSYIEENGKTFWQHPDGTLTRSHDANFKGARFDHKRCPFCNRITSMHTLHWLNHIKACSKMKYSASTFLKLRYYALDNLQGYGLTEWV